MGLSRPASFFAGSGQLQGETDRERIGRQLGPEGFDRPGAQALLIGVPVTGF